MAVAGVLREASADSGGAVRRLVGVASTVQQRFEGSAIGEALISTLVSGIVLIGVVYGSPDSAFRRAALPSAEPAAFASGLDQSWYMFAPDPYRQQEIIEVHATTARGEERVWRVPHGNMFDQFSWYHWHKITEQSVRQPFLRADLTRWAAGQVLQPADYPAQVALILKTRSLAPPGASHSQEKSGSETLFDETVAGPP